MRVGIVTTKSTMNYIGSACLLFILHALFEVPKVRSLTVYETMDTTRSFATALTSCSATIEGNNNYDHCHITVQKVP